MIRLFGLPLKIKSPPFSPPSGPKSIILSEHFIRSKLCSTTTIEWPLSISELKDFSNAIKDFTKVIELTSSYAEAYFNRGLANYEFSKYSKAIDDFTKAIEINPEDGDSFFGRGLVKSEIYDYDEAIDDYTAAILLNPEDDRFYYYRGLSKFEIEDDNGACEDLKKALELGSPDALTIINEFCD